MKNAGISKVEMINNITMEIVITEKWLIGLVSATFIFSASYSKFVHEEQKFVLFS
jgi:hypothetical protein